MNNKSLIGKIVQWATGFGSYGVFIWLYDYFVFSYVIWRFGPIYGGVFMLVITFFIDLLTLKFYDWSKKDWLAIEYIKDLKSHEGFIGKIFDWLHSRGLLFVIIFMAIKFNPFIVTAYARKGSYKYDGLSKRDWIIFISSSIIGGVYWIVAITLGVTVLEYLYMSIF